MNKAFGIKESLSFGWAQVKKNFWFLALFTLATLVVGGILGGGKNPSVLGRFLNVLISLFAAFTFARIGLDAVKGKIFAWKDAFEINWNVFGTYIIASILCMIAYTVGLVFLIIPGLIILVRLSFFGFIVIEGEASPVHAIKRSWALTEGRFWQLFAFGLVLVLINIAGALVIGIGSLVTVPLALIALAYAYHKLKTA
jgi:uncharacterized membrane protein